MEIVVTIIATVVGLTCLGAVFWTDFREKMNEARIAKAEKQK